MGGGADLAGGYFLTPAGDGFGVCGGEEVAGGAIEAIEKTAAAQGAGELLADWGGVAVARGGVEAAQAVGGLQGGERAAQGGEFGAADGGAVAGDGDVRQAAVNQSSTSGAQQCWAVSKCSAQPMALGMAMLGITP